MTQSPCPHGTQRLYDARPKIGQQNLMLLWAMPIFANGIFVQVHTCYPLVHIHSPSKQVTTEHLLLFVIELSVGNTVSDRTGHSMSPCHLGSSMWVVPTHTWSGFKDDFNTISWVFIRFIFFTIAFLGARDNLFINYSVHWQSAWLECIRLLSLFSQNLKTQTR